MDEAAQNPLLLALTKRWETYQTQLKLCQEEASNLAVHDLRVATRRLLSVIEILRNIHPGAALQKVRKNLKIQLDNMAELRDTQVILAELAKVEEALPEAKPFLLHLQKKERDLLRSSAKTIHTIKIGAMSRNIENITDFFTLIAENEDLSPLILSVLDDAYARILGQVSLVDPERPLTIHQVRIAFRKFRYMVEISHPLVADFPVQNLKGMHDFQDAMGLVQDIEILMGYLNEFFDKRHAFDRKPVLQFYQEKHEAAITAFMAELPKVNTFWRSSHEADFPWKSPARKVRSSPRPKKQNPQPDSTADIENTSTQEGNE